MLRIEEERDRKLIELGKKEEASMLKKEGEMYRLKHEMIAKSKVNQCFYFVSFTITTNIKIHNSSQYIIIFSSFEFYP